MPKTNEKGNKIRVAKNKTKPCKLGSNTKTKALEIYGNRRLCLGGTEPDS